MRKQYDRIMDHVELSDDMRQRILSNIQKADLHPQKKRFSYRTYLSLAACLVVLVAGSLALSRFFSPADNTPVLLTSPDAVACSSAENLSEVVDFAVSDVPQLPFDVTSRTYTAYESQVAEIVYSGEEQTAVFRKSAGEGDNSGYYANYAATAQITVDPRVITLKGGEGSYTIAIWSDGEYACSLRLSSGMPEENWRVILSALPEN